MSYYKSENKISNADWLRSVKSQMGVVNGSRIDESDEYDDFRDPTQSVSGNSLKSVDPLKFGKPPKSVSGTISNLKDVARQGGNVAAVGLGGLIAGLQSLDPSDLSMIVMKIKNLIRDDHPDIADKMNTSKRLYSQNM